MDVRDRLRFGPPLEGDVHICVAMQRLFAEDTAWHTPRMERVLPKVLRVARAHPDRTMFTRFVPARTPDEASGTWVRYDERRALMTREHLGDDMVELVPELATLVPPATLLDEKVHSPWFEPDLHRRLRARGCQSVVISGGETDVCVLATVLGAVDRGYRVVIVADALCSSSDAIHDATLDLDTRRYGQQVETVTTEALLRGWA